MIFNDVVIRRQSIYIDASLTISYILDKYNHLSTTRTPFPLSGVLIKTYLLLHKLLKVLYIRKAFFVGLYKLTCEF